MLSNLFSGKFYGSLKSIFTVKDNVAWTINLIVMFILQYNIFGNYYL